MFVYPKSFYVGSKLLSGMTACPCFIAALDWLGDLSPSFMFGETFWRTMFLHGPKRFTFYFQVIWASVCGSKNRYQNGTLVSGNMDQNPRFAPRV